VEWSKHIASMKTAVAPLWRAKGRGREGGREGKGLPQCEEAL